MSFSLFKCAKPTHTPSDMANVYTKNYDDDDDDKATLTVDMK